MCKNRNNSTVKKAIREILERVIGCRALASGRIALMAAKMKETLRIVVHPSLSSGSLLF